MFNLEVGNKVGIIVLSNGLPESQKENLKKLEEALMSLKLQAVYGDFIYRTKSVYAASDHERAKQLMDFFKDDQIKAIFDVSGGDLANGVLPYLDYDFIQNYSKPFFGYSDLTVVLNAMYTKAKTPTCLYQIKNLVNDHGDLQLQRFKYTFFENKKDLFNINYQWVQGSQMKGIVVGGNIRCLLKLAGTPYFPDFEGKILFLESLSGDVAKMATYLNQYKQLGVFEKIKGLILGSFTEMEGKCYKPTITSLATEIIDNPKLPMVKTSEVGHGSDSKALIIGEILNLIKE